MAEQDQDDPWLESLRALRRKQAELQVAEDEWYVLQRLLTRAEKQRDALRRELAELKERTDALYIPDTAPGKD